MNERTTHDSARDVDQILDERAQALAKVVETASQDVGETHVVVRVGDEPFALPVHVLRRVIRRPRLTPLYGAPPQFCGLARVSGEIVAVIHAGSLLGIGSDDPAEILLVLESPLGLVGWLVHRLDGFRQIHEYDLALGFVPTGGGTARIARATTKDLVTLVNPDALFNHPGLRLLRREAS
jgi:chemotaxis signal transduction protein